MKTPMQQIIDLIESGQQITIEKAAELLYFEDQLIEDAFKSGWHRANAFYYSDDFYQFYKKVDVFNNFK